MTEFNKQLQLLIGLAKTPGWKAYAWHRAKELERCETGMWDGIAEALTQAMASVAAARQPALVARG